MTQKSTDLIYMTAEARNETQRSIWPEIYEDILII